MDIVQLYDFIVRGGLPALLMVFIWLLLKGIIRFGREFERQDRDHEARLAEVTKDRDEWKQRSLHYIDLTGQATNLTETTVSVAKQRLGGRS